jgi:hypothetical protein
MERHTLTVELLSGTFAVAQLDPASPVPSWAETGDLVCVTRTPTELSIVCDEGSVPSGVQAQRGFRCLRVIGPLDFAETGILEALAGPLAQAGVSIFALSTYDTDYVLMPADQLKHAVCALHDAGHTVRQVGAA